MKKIRKDEIKNEIQNYINQGLQIYGITQLFKNRVTAGYITLLYSEILIEKQNQTQPKYSFFAATKNVFFKIKENKYLLKGVMTVVLPYFYFYAGGIPSPEKELITGLLAIGIAYLIEGTVFENKFKS